MKQKVVVVGATGFVGRHLCPALKSAGHFVRGTGRAADRSAAELGVHEYVSADTDNETQLRAALQGCDSAYFLVHRVGTGHDYAQHEAEMARRFAEAAEQAGVTRIIYLGGVMPAEGGSRHLMSRENTGRILRQGGVPCLELRAAMIIGARSISWTIVRDLAARLPAMVLPEWLGNHSWPVDIDDVVYALVGALGLPAEHGIWELPGPERLTHRNCLERTASAFGRHTPMLRVPVVTPALSSYWIAMVTRADLDTIRELVEGLRFELEPSHPRIWDQLPPCDLVEFDVAVAQALQDECDASMPSRRRLERLQRLGARFVAPKPPRLRVAAGAG